MDKNQILRKLPPVEKLLEEPKLSNLENSISKSRLVAVLRDSIEEVRQDLIDSMKKGDIPEKSEEDLKRQVISISLNAISSYPYSFKPIVNATGIVLHTNLGRAPLPKEALERIVELSSSYSNLEYDISTGKRGERYDHVRKLLCDITGAQDALVVNNNAAAVLLCLSALAFGKEVIISRGQLVEIGGSFRIPDIMIQSGAQLVEVGTTNKTYIYDYEQAINDNTGLLLKVHTSNFKVVGFSAQVDNHELSCLGEKCNIPVMEDLGSGILVDLKPFGFPEEPTVKDSIKSGMDIVTFSGDKLLGGPQAGIIVGDGKLIEIIKNHPLTRAVRIDKMTLAALEVVLMFYKDEMYENIPTLYMLTKPMKIMEQDAMFLAKGLREKLGDKGTVHIIDDVSEAGGGSFPGHVMPTKAVEVSLKNMSAGELSRRLRNSSVPIIGRVRRDMLVLDVRTMNREDIYKTIEMVESLI